MEFKQPHSQGFLLFRYL